MGKISNLSVWKRFVSGMVAVVLMFSAHAALGEDSEVSIGDEAGIGLEYIDEFTEESFRGDIASIKEKMESVLINNQFSATDIGAQIFGLGGFNYCDAELIKELIRKGLIYGDEEKLLSKNLKNNFALCSVFMTNGLHAKATSKKEKEKIIDLSIFFYNKKDYEFFQKNTESLNAFAENYEKALAKRNKKFKLDELKTFMDEFIEVCENMPLECVNENCILYCIYRLAYNEIGNAANFCIPKKEWEKRVDLDRSLTERLVPLKGVTLDYHNNNPYDILLGALDAVNKTGKILDGRMQIYDGMLKEKLDEVKDGVMTNGTGK